MSIAPGYRGTNTIMQELEARMGKSRHQINSNIMSWSVNYIGSPSNIIAAMKKHSDSLSGKSKEEFDAALPPIAELLKQNHNKNAEPVLKLSAAGHAHDGYSSCTVNIENIGGVLV